MANFAKKFLPAGLWERVRSAVLFRAEDPANLHQVLPQRVNPTTVERIQGFRYPAPGSRVGAKVPTRESEDRVYDISAFTRDNRNLLQEEVIIINSKTRPQISFDNQHLPSHGKRKINLLPYDPSGLRTTKTATWELLAPELKKAAPNHLVAPSWYAERDEWFSECEKKGLSPIGKRHKFRETTNNYNTVKW